MRVTLLPSFTSLDWRERHSTASSMLWFLLVTACAGNAGGGRGRFHRMGCWGFYFVIWVARWQSSGFVWFLGSPPCPALVFKKNSSYDGEAIALSSARENKVPGWAENAAVCGDDMSPWTDDIERHRIHGWFGVGDGDDRQKNSAECMLLRIRLWHHDQQRISIWSRWESIFCAINYPGSWSDGTLTTHFFSHIKGRIGDYKICVNQGFPRSGDATGVLVGPIPERTARWLHLLVRDNFYPSI